VRLTVKHKRPVLTDTYAKPPFCMHTTAKVDHSIKHNAFDLRHQESGRTPNWSSRRLLLTATVTVKARFNHTKAVSSSLVRKKD